MRITSNRLNALLDYLKFLDRVLASRLIKECSECTLRVEKERERTLEAINEGTEEGVIDNG